MTFTLNNRYQVEKKIGSGGFGETFLARDINLPSRRYCVIKQLKPVATDPNLYQLIQDRFNREAVTLEKIGDSNSNIPSLYAYFEEGNHFYLVQEWIDGETLTEKVRQEGIFSSEPAQDILTRCLHILDAVHNQGIIHRDIKPDNIILRKSDGQPVLIDFGAVKETMNTTMSPSKYQASSIVIGTPGFMPSEQLIGRPVFSSDLYALALTVIYLLTSKLPQELGTDPIHGFINWKQYASEANPRLVSVLDKAIQPHSRDRFLSVHEMIHALNGSVSMPTELVTQKIQHPYPDTTIIEKSSPQSEAWQKFLILGITIGSFTLIGLVAVAFILKQSAMSPVSSSSNTEATPEKKITPNNPIQTSGTLNTEIAPQEKKEQVQTEKSFQPESNRSSAQEVITEYYTFINQGEFQNAWSMLPSDLQENRKVHPNGYNSFAEWFQKVSPVNINSLKTIQQSSQYSVVDISYSGYLNNKLLSMKLRYRLRWNASQNKWLIQSVQKI
ncbi:protein kinase domain-containing protein [Limnothrix redekei]|uniref:non-specific serine/threonine protein kinase n=1 Tax=Limnothrix redekei LRLZ20PSL1 TaxID=3112953 RepID=A0ABW7C8X2_9CYAN